MNIPVYTSGEFVRIEILAYENPEGLHPAESSWRDLSRKLLNHIKELQMVLDEIKAKPNNTAYNQNLKEWKPIQFPKKFESAQQ
jgi:hypothetical protein